MDLPIYELAHLLRALRKRVQMTQRQVVAELGCRQPYLARVETANSVLSYKYAVKLEKLYGVEAGTFQRASYKRGRPAMAPYARQLRRKISETAGAPKVARRPIRRPRHPRPDGAKVRNNVFLLMECESLAQLERTRQQDEYFWRKARSAHFDSRPEKAFFLDAAAAAKAIVGASFQSLGCTLHSANGITGRDTNHLAHPALLLNYLDMAVAILPQRCIQTATGYLWPDVTLVVAAGDRKLTLVTEIDGPTHVDSEEARDKKLGVPVYHLPADQAGKPGTLERILQWARSKLDEVT